MLWADRAEGDGGAFVELQPPATTARLADAEGTKELAMTLPLRSSACDWANFFVGDNADDDAGDVDDDADDGDDDSDAEGFTPGGVGRRRGALSAALAASSLTIAANTALPLAISSAGAQ